MKTTLTAATILITALSFGCGDDPKANTADDVTSSSTSSGGTKKPPGEGSSPDTQSGVKIDEKIVKACGDLPTARFAFDSTEVTQDAANALDALARCFISGPLKGSKGVRLVGHADNTGPASYNMGLGQRRAGSIGEFLAKKGLEEKRINAMSMGETEATGSDEAGWAADRKVEVLLAE